MINYYKEGFYAKKRKKIYISATPGDFEKETSQQIVEQIIRPTGLLDPKIEVKPVSNQVDDLIEQINTRIENIFYLIRNKKDGL